VSVQIEIDGGAYLPANAWWARLRVPWPWARLSAHNESVAITVHGPFTHFHRPVAFQLTDLDHVERVRLWGYRFHFCDGCTSSLVFRVPGWDWRLEALLKSAGIPLVPATGRRRWLSRQRSWL
jgi:hypothetical protein